MSDTAQPIRPASRRQRCLQRRPVIVATTAVFCLPLLATATASTAIAPDRQSVGETTAATFADPITYATTVTDADDTDGRLDMARVHHRIRVVSRHDVRIRYAVTTHDPFAVSRLGPRFRHFVLELNRDNERGSERNVLISYADGRLVAEVTSNATRETIATVAVTRIDSRTLRVSGPRALIGARSYFWTSNFHARWSTDCGQGDGYPITCQDTLPGRGWIRLDAPAWPVEP